MSAVENSMGKTKKLKRSDILVGFFLLMVIAISKANIVSLPYYWDEMDAYIWPAHWLTNGSLLSVLPGLHPPDIFFGHPFALYLVLGAIYRIFGESIIVSHLFILMITFIGIYYTYLLGKYLHNRTVGFMASILLLFSPLYFAQCGMVTGDLVITTLGVASTYYFLKRNYTGFLISSILMVLTKESATAFVVAFLIYLFFEERKSPQFIKNMVRYSIPLIAILLFFIVQKITTGIFLPNPYFNSHNFFVPNLNDLFFKLRQVFFWIFIEQWRMVISVFIIINILIHRKSALRKEYALFGLLFFFLSELSPISIFYFAIFYRFCHIYL